MTTTATQKPTTRQSESPAKFDYLAHLNQSLESLKNDIDASITFIEQLESFAVNVVELADERPNLDTMNDLFSRIFAVKQINAAFSYRVNSLQTLIQLNSPKPSQKGSRNYDFLIFRNEDLKP